MFKEKTVDAEVVNDAGDFGKEIATVKEEQHEGVVAIFDQSPAAFYSSIDSRNATMGDKAKVLAALGDPTFKVADVTNKILCVTDVVAHRVKIADMNTGETRPADRIVLILADGQTVAGVSDGFKQSLNNVMGLFGQPSWKTAENPNGLPLIIKSVTCKRGHTYNLIVATTEKFEMVGKAK